MQDRFGNRAHIVSTKNEPGDKIILFGHQTLHNPGKIRWHRSDFYACLLHQLLDDHPCLFAPVGGGVNVLQLNILSDFGN